MEKKDKSANKQSAEQQVLSKLDNLQQIQTQLVNEVQTETASQFKQKNPLSLAFFGDAFFSYSVRNFLFVNFDYKPNTLNKLASSVECARKQAEFALKLFPTLNEEEKEIYMRARNSHPNNKAKNASYEEYHLATAFEAVYGFWALNLSKYKNRIMEVYKMIAEAVK